MSNDNMQWFFQSYVILISMILLHSSSHHSATCFLVHGIVWSPIYLSTFRIAVRWWIRFHESQKDIIVVPISEMPSVSYYRDVSLETVAIFKCLLAYRPEKQEQGQKEQKGRWKAIILIVFLFS